MSERLLIVDDEPDFRAYVRQVGEGVGFEVTEAGEPAAFMKLYEDLQPEAIVLDIILPNADGIELVRWLANRGFGGRLAVVTGHNPRYARAAEALGAASGMKVTILTKPVRLADLRAALAAP
jgi:CheY-like chemotaxis protein